jgi:predicted nucleotidyltransferase component of viral defense system
LQSANTIGLFGFIDDVKVDFVKHAFPLIAEPLIDNSIRLISIPDIIAMKVNAVLKRAVKKDFWDIAELLQHYSLQSMIDFYEQKFPDQRLMITIPQALTYFEDAENSPEPSSLKGQTWQSVKSIINKKVEEYLR